MFQSDTEHAREQRHSAGVVFAIIAIALLVAAIWAVLTALDLVQFGHTGRARF